MKLGRFVAIMSAVLLLAGCAAAPAAPAAPAPTRSAEPTPTELPPREAAEMVYLNKVHIELDTAGYGDKDLLLAGDAVCASLARGDDHKTMFTAVAALLPKLPDLDTVAILAGYANASLCTVD